MNNGDAAKPASHRRRGVVAAGRATQNGASTPRETVGRKVVQLS